MIAWGILGFVVAYLGWSLICMESNAHKARVMKVPIVRLPIDTTNVIWLVIQPLVFTMLDHLPIDWSSYPDFIRFSRRDWQFREKAGPAIRLGSVWALVTPVAIYLQITDPEAIRDIFSRPQSFVRPVKEYKLLEVYGPCLSTAGSEDWARHRKVLAAPFNESIMTFVWDESLRQTQSMLLSWPVSEAAIGNVQQDLKTLAINVLAATAFKKSYHFRGCTENFDEGASYRNTLQTVLDNAILIMLVPYQYLVSPFVPKKLAAVGDAARSFRGHMVEMLEQEADAVRSGRVGSGGMMTSFVRALEVHKKELIVSPDVKTSKDGKKGLSMDEILGNIFILNFAGYDTTANTLGFALYLLAIHPEIQDWAGEEINAVLESSHPTDGNWNYLQHFPQLKRCHAILFETLRLFPPIVAIPKWTSQQSQHLRFADEDSGGFKSIIVPPGVYTSPHLSAIQTHPKYWKEAEIWRPSRWIAPARGVVGTELEKEVLFQPAANTYFPWSDGPQSCPGKKFIQVEGVAVLATLLKTHRLSVLENKGESHGAARNRLLDCVNCVNMEVILRMQNPDSVKLICSRKGTTIN